MDLQVLLLFSVAVFMKILENAIGIQDTGFGSFDVFEMHSNSYELSIDSSPVTEELLTKREDAQTEVDMKTPSIPSCSSFLCSLWFVFGLKPAKNLSVSCHQVVRMIETWKC